MVIIGVTLFTLLVPITTRSGYLKSLIASPSLKNSGLETTSNKFFLFFFDNIFSISSPVPKGTVDFVIIILCLFKLLEIVFATENTLERSAELPSLDGGVPTAINIISDFLIASFISVVKINLLELKFLMTNSSRPGS